MAPCVQGSRSVELVCIVCFVCVTIIGTFSLLFWHRYAPEQHVKCGPSNRDFSIEITGAQQTTDGSHWIKNGQIFPYDHVWKTSKNLFGCPCSMKSCLRKCCIGNMQFDDDLSCNKTSQPETFKRHIRNVYSSQDLSPIRVRDDHFFIFHGIKCAGDLVEVSPEEKPILLDDGRIFIDRMTKKHMNQEDFCVDILDDSLTILECLTQEQSSWMDDLQGYGMLVSVPFFWVTLFVYASLPALHNLHGKALMCHISCLSLAYTAGAVIKLDLFNISIGGTVCGIIAYLFLSMCLGSFFWLNVICTDIWWIFRDISSSCNFKSAAAKQMEHQRFLLYSAYAWGGTTLITAVAMVMDLSPLVPDHYVKPQFGVTGCWFSGDEGRVLYLYLPMGVLLGVNLLMFGTTAYRLWYHRTSRARTGRDKQRFSMFGKLFLVMGLNWMLELVSFLFEVHYVLKIILLVCSGLGNSLQGVIVFFLFVCKRSILRDLRDQICPSLFQDTLPPRTNRSSSCSSRATRSSNLPAALDTTNTLPMSTFDS